MYDELKVLLEAGKITEDEAKTVHAAYEARIKKADDEAAKYRTRAKELSESLEELKGSKETLQKQLASLDERIKKAKEEGKSELAAQLEAERAEKQTLQSTLEQVEAKNRELVMQSALQKALSKHAVVDPEVVAAALERRLVVEEGSVRFKDGESLLDVESGVAKFLEDRPQLLKAGGTPGSGKSNERGGGLRKSAMSDESAAEYIQKHGMDAYLALPA